MQNKSTKIKTLKILAVAVFLIAAALLYYSFNPELSRFFPPCLFKTATGYKCPGCGAQRAIHHLLHFDIVNAFLKNPLLVIALPYLTIGLTVEYTNIGKHYPKIRQILFGRIAIYISLFLVVTYWITRNIFDF